METVSVILPAAGAGTRMGGVQKAFLPLGGEPVLIHSIRTLAALPQTAEIVIVAAPQETEACRKLTAGCPKVTAVVAGGKTRQESVANGIAACRTDTGYFAIHDAARPLLSAENAAAVYADGFCYGAATLGVPAKDTIKQVDQTGAITATPDRTTLYQTQTPQVFRRDVYLAGLTYAKESGTDFTDDCGLIEAAGYPVHMTKGSYRNLKITTPEDLILAKALIREGAPMIRLGHGYDVHRLTKGRPLILGGVTIPYEKGLLGHSDADVLTHAVMDALLGAAALGDIGQHFPDSDPAYRGADSMRLLGEVIGLLQKSGFSLINLDATVLAQSPKLSPYIPAMRERLAAACGLPATQVSIKATTEEGLGFTGSGDGIAAHAVCLIEG